MVSVTGAKAWPLSSGEADGVCDAAGDGAPAGVLDGVPEHPAKTENNITAARSMPRNFGECFI